MRSNFEQFEVRRASQLFSRLARSCGIWVGYNSRPVLVRRYARHDLLLGSTGSQALVMA